LDAFEAQLGALEAAGYDITRVALFEEIDAINDRHTDLVAADAALAHHRRFESHGDQYAEASAELIREGRQIDVGRLASTRVSRTAVREQLDEAMAGHDIDVWVSPGAPGPAPEGIGDTGDPVMNLPWTHAGVPALTVPGGSVDGLPVGLQCTTRFGEDERLLQWSRSIAAAVEGAA
jgi:Asp-tRNA(Asn)/Glu-tRNA(Gln) amidotransferase A subunit family amidase